MLMPWFAQGALTYTNAEAFTRKELETRMTEGLCRASGECPTRNRRDTKSRDVLQCFLQGLGALKVTDVAKNL